LVNCEKLEREKIFLVTLFLFRNIYVKIVAPSPIVPTNMIFPFIKYQGTGNDFILFESSKILEDFLTQAKIKELCDRHLGIGSDGLILLCKNAQYDFEMKFYNPDGKLTSLCGNGSRCAVHYAIERGIVKSKTVNFLASDGAHSAELIGPNIIRIKMKNVEKFNKGKRYFIFDTGSPHYILFTRSEINTYKLINTAKKIRFSEKFKAKGINVNIARIRKKGIEIRTYERGVEDETLSCGTGVVAVALASYLYSGSGDNVTVFTKGGELKVKFLFDEEKKFHEIFLEGAVVKIFEGKVEF